MMNKEKDKLLAKNLETIINHFGVDNQLKKLNEECYELIEAINIFERVAFNCEDDFGDKEALRYRKANIAEEIADCMVLLNQFIKKYNISTLDIQKLFEEKVCRTIKRIEDGYYV